MSRSDGAKHYRGASKLVALHAQAPVAVFWYGSPDYLGVPWEVIFKDFRSTGDERRASLGDYAVRFLPKADLAEFARQLVAFTAFRLRMSMAVETVGEPIDVAVVSRSEGVVGSAGPITSRLSSTRSTSRRYR